VGSAHARSGGGALATAHKLWRRHERHKRLPYRSQQLTQQRHRHLAHESASLPTRAGMQAEREQRGAHEVLGAQGGDERPFEGAPLPRTAAHSLAHAAASQLLLRRCAQLPRTPDALS